MKKPTSARKKLTASQICTADELEILRASNRSITGLYRELIWQFRFTRFWGAVAAICWHLELNRRDWELSLKQDAVREAHTLLLEAWFLSLSPARMLALRDAADRWIAMHGGKR